MNIYKARLLLSQKFPDYVVVVHETLVYDKGADPQMFTHYSFCAWDDNDLDAVEIGETNLTKEELEKEVNALIA